MAKIKSILDIPYHKRPGSRQQATAKSIKALSKDSLDYDFVGTYGRRVYMTAGIFPVADIPSAVKRIRLDSRRDLSITLRDPESEQVIARSHYVGSKDSLLESLMIKMVSKYGFDSTDELEIIVQYLDPIRAKKSAKKAAKKAAKKTPTKKSAKKSAKKTPAKKTPAKKSPKKTPAKKSPKKTPAKKTPAKKTPAKKTFAKKTPAKKKNTFKQLRKNSFGRWIDESTGRFVPNPFKKGK